VAAIYGENRFTYWTVWKINLQWAIR